MSRKRHFATAVCIAAFGIVAVAEAVPGKPADPFDESLEVGALSVGYAQLLDRARTLDVAPRDDLLDQRVATPGELRDGIQELKQRVAEARAAAREQAAYAPSGGSIAGVSLATLNAIAACESGGDPTAVNAAGYYGKYQFDMGTWASVGGSGNPAEASEAEQDYRAALLYSRAGSSPWPVCGA